MESKEIEQAKKILKTQKINFRTIISKAQSPMLQILRTNNSYDLNKKLKNIGLKLVNIDSTTLIYKQ